MVAGISFSQIGVILAGHAIVFLFFTGFPSMLVIWYLVLSKPSKLKRIYFCLSILFCSQAWIVMMYLCFGYRNFADGLIKYSLICQILGLFLLWKSSGWLGNSSRDKASKSNSRLV